ncbi:hypothetical protein NEOKW01_0866 [Nematocida sp. AWRm80]|nr:hypothetical protein NEOKW01_0866 [Nematocida sp. AWRm80]
MRVGNTLVSNTGIGLNRVLRVNESGNTVIFSKNVLPITKGALLKYRLKILKHLPLTIERGVYAFSIGNITNGTVNVINVYNRSIIPDFTTPYLVFGLSGGTIILIVSLFSKVLMDMV